MFCTATRMNNSCRSCRVTLQQSTAFWLSFANGPDGSVLFAFDDSTSVHEMRYAVRRPLRARLCGSCGSAVRSCHKGTPSHGLFHSLYEYTRMWVSVRRERWLAVSFDVNSVRVFRPLVTDSLSFSKLELRTPTGSPGNS